MSTYDPFDLPLDVDPDTGEILTPEPIAEVVVPRTVAPDTFLGAAQLAVDTLDGTEVAGQLKRALQDRLEYAYQLLRAERPDGPATEVSVRPELAMLQAADESLRAVGAAFTSAAKDAAAAAGDVVLEVRAEKAEQVTTSGGSTSVRFGANGGVYLATYSQPTQAWADADAIIDVLVAVGLDAPDVLNAEPGGVVSAGTAQAWAEGARFMAHALMNELLASPSWKSTALDKLRLQLEGGESTSALGDRLRAAYGRKPQGEARVAIKRQADKA